MIPKTFSKHTSNFQHYLLLLAICVLAYWPISFGFFSLKNDAIHYFLPYRFQVSEAIRNGEWPFWSPYIYLGYPIFGDMQSGAWNPFVWFFSIFTRYDLSVLHLETLLYIFLGGVGMYKLTKSLVFHSETALLIAVSYMLGGFMLNGQLINWLAAAAFFPFVIHYYLGTVHTGRFAPAIKTGFSLYLMFVSGYPSFFIVTCYILLVLFLQFVFDYFQKRKPSRGRNRFLLQQLVILAVFIGLSAPAIISFLDLLPYYERGTATTYANTLSNSFELQHLSSLLFPTTIQAKDIITETDITCRNVYCGIFVILLLIAVPPKFNRRNTYLLLLATGALLFSLGDATPVRKLCYQFLPLMDSFRHPSQMRLFFLFAILLVIAPSLKILLSGSLTTTQTKKLRWTAIGMGAAIGLVTLLAGINSSLLGNFDFQYIFSTTGFKSMLDHLRLNDAVVISGLIQIAFMLGFIFWIRKKRDSGMFIIALWILNLFIFAQLILPSSFISTIAPAEINKLIHAAPKGFLVRDLEKPIAVNSADALDNYEKISLSYFYNKKIGISDVAYSPSFLTQQEAFLESKLKDYVANRPVAYLADTIIKWSGMIPADSTHCNIVFIDSISTGNKVCTPGDSAIIQKISANSFRIATKTTDSAMLVLTQNYHHYWHAWVDGAPSPLFKSNISFMSVRIPPGSHEIIIRFVPSRTLIGLWVLLATTLLVIAGLIALKRWEHR